MQLVDWNGDKTAGRGRSGTRYAISCGLFTPEATAASWIVEVDGEKFCAAASSDEAIARTEQFEALRCFLLGRAAEMTDRHLDQALTVASEMQRAAEETLSEFLAAGGEGLPQVAEVQASLTELRALQARIGREERRRLTVPAGATLH